MPEGAAAPPADILLTTLTTCAIRPNKQLYPKGQNSLKILLGYNSWLQFMVTIFSYYKSIKRYTFI